MGESGQKGPERIAMLTPEFLLRIVEASEEAAGRLNNYLTKRVVDRILSLFEKEGKVELIPSSVSDVRKMKEAGMLEDDIRNAIKEGLPELEKEVDNAFTAAANEIERDQDRFVKEIFEKEKITDDIPGVKAGKYKEIKELNLTRKEKRMLQQTYEKTNGTMENLTGTTGSSWRKKYIQACDEAIWKANHGVSPTQAIAEAIDQCAKYGTEVEYPSGHTDKIEVAVARAVRTGIAQAAGETALARCAEAGVRQVVISSHLGARYTPREEPANHMGWQGKVFDLDWKKGKLAEYKVTPKEEEENEEKFGFLSKMKHIFARKRNQSAGDFLEKTGYGTGPGLCGWNCRHSFGPFYPGVSDNGQKQYRDSMNKKQYDLEQKQRSMERKLREIRRRKDAAKYGSDKTADSELQEELAKKYRDLKKKYEDGIDAYDKFCEDNKLKSRKERLKIARENYERKR